MLFCSSLLLSWASSAAPRGAFVTRVWSDDAAVRAHPAPTAPARYDATTTRRPRKADARRAPLTSTVRTGGDVGLARAQRQRLPRARGWITTASGRGDLSPRRWQEFNPGPAVQATAAGVPSGRVSASILHQANAKVQCPRRSGPRRHGQLWPDRIQGASTMRQLSLACRVTAVTTSRGACREFSGQGDD